LLNINKKPFLYFLIKIFKKNNIKKVFLFAQYKNKQIKEYVKKIKGVQFKILLDGKQRLGTGGSLYKHLQLLPNKFYLTYGDSYLDFRYSKLRNKFFIKKKSIITIYKNKNTNHKNNILFNRNKIINYNKNYNYNYNYIDYGLFYLKKEHLEKIKVKYKKFDLDFYIKNLIINNDLDYIISKKKFLECGSKEGIKKISKILI
jgi:NDP-sugar pyrophosphorylase family protein